MAAPGPNAWIPDPGTSSDAGCRSARGLDGRSGQGARIIATGFLACQRCGERFSHLARPRRWAGWLDRVLEATGADDLARILTRELPAALGVAGATLLLWNRKLDSFEALIAD